jgi:hypothetical protein
MKIKKNGEVIELTESDIKKMKKLINEDGFVGGISASDKALLVQDVINRINEFGLGYELRLRELNSEFLPTKVRTLDRSQEDIIPNPNLRISKTTYHNR